MVFCWYAALQQDLTVSEWDLETQRLETAVGGAADPAGVPPSSVRRHIFTWAKTHTHTRDQRTHKVNHVLGNTHKDVDAHLTDQPQPLRASSRDFRPWPRWGWGRGGGEHQKKHCERRRALEVSSGGSPGRAPIISVCLPCQSPTASPWSLNRFIIYSPKEARLPLLTLWIVLGWKNHLMNQRQSVSLIRL